MDYQLSEYFYKNVISYNQQRYYLQENIQQYANDLFKSPQNKALLSYIKDLSLVTYILNDMQNDYYNKEEKNNIKYLNKMYRRWIIILIVIVITFYLIFVNKIYTLEITKYSFNLNIIYPVFLFLLFIIYFSYKTFKVSAKNKEYCNTYITDYVQDKKYNRLFWLFTLLQLYLFWILIIKANVITADQELLWEMFDIKIKKIFSLEEKIAFFYHYLDFIITMTELHKHPEIIESIKLFIGELVLKDVITESTTLTDLKMSLEDIIYNSLLYYQDKITISINPLQSFLRSLWPFMDFITNLINLIVFWKFFVVYVDAFYLTMTTPSIRILKLIHFFCISFVKYRYKK